MLPGALAPASATAKSPAKRMIHAANEWRAAHGLGALRGSKRLNRSAKGRARRMIRHDFFAHPSRLYVPRFDRVGEVLELHGGKRARVRRTLRKWANSPGHRAVLLSSSFRRIGAGRASGWYQGQRVTIWVVRVGTR